MRYEIEYNVEAQRDLRQLSPDVARRVIEKINRMADGLTGDVKRLRNHALEYRLRVGDWRVIFAIESNTISDSPCESSLQGIRLRERNMLKMKPTFIEENGKAKFVVFSMKDYATIKEALEDAEDSRILNESRRRGAGKPLIPHNQILEEFGLSHLIRKAKKPASMSRASRSPK